MIDLKQRSWFHKNIKEKLQKKRRKTMEMKIKIGVEEEKKEDGKEGQT